MSHSNGWRKVKNISIIIGIILGIGALGRWYMAYAQNSAATAETLKTHTKEIADLEDIQKQTQQIDLEQTKILITLQEFFRITQSREWREASESADSIIVELNNCEPDSVSGDSNVTVGYWTDNLEGDSSGNNP